MIRNVFHYSIAQRVCQLAISKQYLKTQHRLYAINHVYRNLLRPTYQLTLNIRAMASGDGKDLRFQDIHKLVNEKLDKLDKKVCLIDVRQPEEVQETGLIPGFVHIPLAEVPAALKASAEDFKKKYGFDKPSKDDVLVFSCRTGKRSSMALKDALQHGYEKSKHYAGGWTDWADNIKKTKK